LSLNDLSPLGTAVQKQPISSDTFLQARKVLNERDWKGYGYECYIHNLLLFHGLKFRSNPLQDPKLWKKSIGSGPDFEMPELDVEIEAKNVYRKVWVGSIKPHYLKRFRGRKHRLIVINDPDMLPTSAVKTIEKSGAKVLNPFMLIQYIFRLIQSLLKPEPLGLKANSITRTLRRLFSPKLADFGPFKAIFNRSGYEKPAKGPPGSKKLERIQGLVSGNLKHPVS